MELKYKMNLFVGILFFILLSANIESSLGNLATSDFDFSDELQHEVYTPIESLSDFYDGIDTFFYETIGNFPSEWLDETTGAGVSAFIKELQDGHRNCLQISDGGAGTAKATYYFPVDFTLNQSNLKREVVSFWIQLNPITKRLIFNLDLSDNTNFKLQLHDNNKFIAWTNLTNQQNSVYTFNAQWYYVQILFFYDIDKTYLVLDIFDSNLNPVWDIELGVMPFTKTNCYITKLSIETLGVYSGYSGYLDSLLYYSIDLEDKLDITITPYLLQIQGVYPSKNGKDNRYELDSTKLFSAYESIIDKYPHADNNYRTWFITDIVNNVNLLNKSRLLRLQGTDESENKYKVIQLYFDDLNENNSFRENYSQNINIRTDSYDSSDNLINKYYFNMWFNQSHGLINWNTHYRESLAIPRWKTQPTNPIFNFSDYLEPDELLTNLQINVHFFLSYNESHKLIFIRTEVNFNNQISKTYSYDKIIDAGRLYTFYSDQVKLKVRYIDYFNNNSAIDYLGKDTYTYNNLRGIRTLRLNSTDYKYNFLDCGFFNDDLDYYIPPEPPEDIPPEGTDEPRKPDLPYWTFDTYQLENHKNTTISYTNDYIWFNSTGTHTTTYNFGNVRGKKVQGYFPYHDDFIKSKHLPDLSFSLLGVKFEFLNDMLDFFRTIGNTGLVAAQFALFVGWGIMINYIGMYLIMALIVPFFVNAVWFWTLSGLLYAGHWIIIGVLSLVGVLWNLGAWLWEFLITHLIPLLFEFIIIVLALIIALGIWLTSGGTVEFYIIFLEVHTMLSVVFDFLLESIIYFVDNIAFFLLYILLYTVNVLLYIPKMAFCKSKGFYKRALQLEDSFKVLILPFVWAYKLLIAIKDMIKWW